MSARSKNVAESSVNAVDETALLGGGWSQKFSRGFGKLVNALLPPTCPSCKTIVQDQGGLCAACWKLLHWIEEPVCARLGIPLSYDLGPGAVSAEALADPPEFDRLRSVVTYDGTAPSLIEALKFRDQTHIAQTMGAMMARAGRSLLGSDAVLAPVPLHPVRQMRRRYNQAALLANAVGDATGLPVVHDGLKRIKSTKQQLGLSRGERLRNVDGAFAVTPKGSAAFAGKRVVLVDDVATTGATLNALSRALHQLPTPGKPLGIDALTFAKVVSGIGATI